MVMNLPSKESLEIIFNLSMLGFVSGSMIALGLNLTIAQIIAPFKHVKIVIRALLANFLIVPLVAYGLVSVLPISEGVRIGIILLSLSGGAPFIPMIVATAKSHVGSSVGLMVTLLIITIFFMPVVVPRMLEGTLLNSWDIAKSLLAIMLLPLALALSIKASFPRIAARLQPYAARLPSISIVVLLGTVIALYSEVILASASILPVIPFILPPSHEYWLSGGW
ncbi:MAG: bile acid:sodium symporter [Candidatus Methanofishera endochildressiae]|uniref:Bile acid:sodium symporter n=1 Tax=Candidatus Methanofishera endochildressiae TaxID=2738884 RepID=A0A7Z0SCK0_9GAMM|nr:bile acid:sodium symporter [Candidatus Methanofishera endochildressiae]